MRKWRQSRHFLIPSPKKETVISKRSEKSPAHISNFTERHKQ
ncbi:hypothetical protein [Viscerimonas tarda]